LGALRALGFSGSDADVILHAAREAPILLNAACSASAMWTANAATVSASADTADGRVHFTAANLNNKFHRSIEHQVTSRLLKAMFPDEGRFAHHAALPGTPQFGDEGAANHTRFCAAYGRPGVELFVYGARGFDPFTRAPKRFPARQTLEASMAVARLHQLPSSRTVFAQQNPDVIDAGVFHNDVIAVGNGSVLFCHQDAFLDQAGVYAEIEQKLGHSLTVVEVPRDAVSVDDAVNTYLFNSQLLTAPDGRMQLVVPEECRANPRTWAYLQELVGQGTPISDMLVFDLRESMRNGGGPACLRLRVELSAAEAAGVNPAVLMNDSLYTTLVGWVEKHYRDRIAESDLGDPALLMECRTALDELTGILQLGSVYDFQRER
jgi:succinylarginine dihydrolase